MRNRNLNNFRRILISLMATAFLVSLPRAPLADVRGTGDLGLVVERASGSLTAINSTTRRAVGKISGLGDLSHASLVYSPDERYAFVFGRDGALTKVDVLENKIVNRVEQAHNSVGGAISQDGRLIATSNYDPGGVRVFSADTLEKVADIKAEYGDGQLAKVVGLVDAPGQKFVFTRRALLHRRAFWRGRPGPAGFMEPGCRHPENRPGVRQERSQIAGVQDAASGGAGTGWRLLVSACCRSS
jgi:hypothetical protein